MISIHPCALCVDSSRSTIMLPFPFYHWDQLKKMSSNRRKRDCTAHSIKVRVAILQEFSAVLNWYCAFLEGWRLLKGCPFLCSLRQSVPLPGPCAPPAPVVGVCWLVPPSNGSPEEGGGLLSQWGKVQHSSSLASLKFLENKCKWIFFVKIKVSHFLWPGILSIPR